MKEREERRRYRGKEGMKDREREGKKEIERKERKIDKEGTKEREREREKEGNR